MTLSRTELERFAARLAASPDLCRPPGGGGDARAYEQVWDAEDVNAWVICWNEGHDTGFHDHDDSAAAIFVIEGCVREERLRLGVAPEVRVLRPGRPFFVAAPAIHRVLHTGQVPAITLHAYSPPLRRTGSYSITADGGLERAAQPYEQELGAEMALR
jgi:quercetin dioxygenase-like cupin family protein